MSEPTLPAKGELFADRYLIECSLGEGFESKVLGASDRETGRRVAIKLWTGAHAEQAVAAVRAYMRLAYESGLYEHPNLVEVFAAELRAGLGYSVSEWLEGTTLGRELQRVHPSPLEDVFEHVLPCMRAMAEAHASGIVHGDIRPGHIFLCRATRHRQARARVFDFGRGMPGFQELRAHKRPTLDEVCHYTTPEQLQSEPLDAKSDQYAFGVMLYEMLAGELPFSADNGNDLALEIVAGAVQLLADKRSSLPLGLSDIVARAMAADPAERFPDLATLIEALEAFDPQHTDVPAPAARYTRAPYTQPPSFTSPAIGAYDWSLPDSSEPRGVMIPAQPPERGRTFLPRAALAGAITAAVISAVYLDDDLLDKITFQAEEPRSHQLQPQPLRTAASHSPLQRAAPAPVPSGAIVAPQRRPAAPAGAQVTRSAPPSMQPSAASSAPSQKQQQQLMLPSALPELPAHVPMMEPVEMPAHVTAPIPASALSGREDLDATGRQSPQPGPVPLKGSEFPPLEVPSAERSAAPAVHAKLLATPQPTAADNPSTPAPTSRPAVARRRGKANTAEAIERLDRMQLQ